MSIKSKNIDFTIIPTPPLGFTYIGNDELGNFVMKKDNGDIVYPAGITTLAGLTDVLISSGITLGEVLMWDGSKWVNGDVIPDLSNYYTKSEVDSGLTSLETDLMSEISGLTTSLNNEINNRISGDTSLSVRIDNIPVYDDSNLWTSLSGETIERISGDTSLENVINNIPVYNDSNLWTTTSGLTTSLNTEISNRISGDTSLENKINTLPFGSYVKKTESFTGETQHYDITYTQNHPVNNALTNQYYIRRKSNSNQYNIGYLYFADGDMSITGGLQSTRVGHTSSSDWSTIYIGSNLIQMGFYGGGFSDYPIQLFNRLYYTNKVIELSGDIQVDGLSGRPGVIYYKTDVSAHYTDRSLVDKAYVDSKGGSFSGGTIDHLNIENDLYVCGYSNHMKKKNNANTIRYIKNNYSGFPTGYKLGIESFDNGIIEYNIDRSNFSVFYDDNTAQHYGTGQLTTANGYLVQRNNRITKLINGRVDKYDIVNGKIDTTTHLSYSTGNANFIENTTYNVNITNSNNILRRHKSIGNVSYIRDAAGKLLRCYWTGNVFTIDLVASNIGSFSAYLSGSTEVVRVITSGLTMDVYHNGTFVSSESLNTNWKHPSDTLSFAHTALLEENNNYIVFVYNNRGCVFNKNTGTYTYSSSFGMYTCNHQSSCIETDRGVIYYWNNHTITRIIIASNNTYTHSNLWSTLTIEGDMVMRENIMYASSGMYAADNGFIKVYYTSMSNLSDVVMERPLNSQELVSDIDLGIVENQIYSSLSTTNSNLAVLDSKLTEYTHTLERNNLTVGYTFLPNGYRLIRQNPSHLQDAITGDNISSFNKHYTDIFMVDNRFIFIMETTSTIDTIRNLSISGVCYYDIFNPGFTYIETGITFTDILFNKRDNLISYRDTTNNLLKVYDCKTFSVIKSVAYTSPMWIIPVDNDKYCIKTTGSTFEIRRISDDSLIKNTAYTPTWRTYNIMYYPYTQTIIAWNSDISPAYSINIWSGRGVEFSSNAYSQGYYTEDYIFIGQGSNVAEIAIYNKYLRKIGSFNQNFGRVYSISNGKIFTFSDTSNSNRIRLVY